MRRLALVILLAAGSESQAACPPEVAARLQAVHLSAAAIARACAATQTLTMKGAILQIHPALVDAFTQAMLPIAVPISGGAGVVNLTEGVYCGPAGEHAGNFLVAATGKPSGGGASHLAPADCQGMLDAIASRVATAADAGDYAVAARLRVEWSPWTLNARVTEADAHTRDGGRPADWSAMNAALTSGPLQSLPVDSVAVVRSANPTRPILMAVMFYFNPTTIGIVGIPSSETAAVSDVRALPPYAALASDFDGAPGNVTLMVSDSAVNSASIQYFTTGPVSIRVAQPLNDVDVEGLAVNGARGSFVIDMRGRFSSERYVGKMILTGKPLVVTRVEMDADCPPSEKADKCGFRRQLAGFTAMAVTQSLGTTPWNPFSKDQVVPIPWGGSTVTLKGQIKEVDAIAGGLVLHCDFSLTKP